PARLRRFRRPAYRRPVGGGGRTRRRRRDRGAGGDRPRLPCSRPPRAAEPRAHATRLTSLARRIGARRNVAMWVSELWRYPVKSMAGEPMHTVLLCPDGIDGASLLPLP